MNSVKFIGMDVHKKTITIAIAEKGSRESARVYGTINNDFDALDKFCRKMLSTSNQLYFVYEAGPCGYSIYRHLTQKGFDCIVAAPSMIPRKSGDRIKNDHRDAKSLACLHRSAELTAVYVPDTQDEAMRLFTPEKPIGPKPISTGYLISLCLIVLSRLLYRNTSMLCTKTLTAFNV